MKHLWYCILLLFITLACKPGTYQSKNTLRKEQLYGNWGRNYNEETQAGIKVFRPESYDFPPSRGREKWLISDDSTISVIRMGAADKPEKQEGKWKIKDSTMTIYLPDNKQRYDLIKVSGSILKVKKKD